MKILMLFLLVLTCNDIYSQDSKNKKPKEKSYNPHSLILPKKEVLARTSPDRVLDMGASAFALSYYGRALYFYTNAMVLFRDEPRIFAQANYETGFIYYNRGQYAKALEYFTTALQIKGVPMDIQELAKMMSQRITDRKGYKAFLKQEDLVFLSDRAARSALDRQIAKEERIAARTQRALAKERKKREKEEAKRIAEEQKNVEKAYRN